jgi:hypothetical protein
MFNTTSALGLGIIPTPGMGEQEIVSITARNPFIHKKPYVLKAHDISAQGNALGR